MGASTILCTRDLLPKRFNALLKFDDDSLCSGGTRFDGGKPRINHGFVCKATSVFRLLFRKRRLGGLQFLLCHL